VHYGALYDSRFFVALLVSKTPAVLSADFVDNRVFPVTVKLTQNELREVTEHASGLGQARSEWIRGVVLAELQRTKEPQKADPLLAEIVGIRLMLRNLLAPLAAGMEPMTKQRVEAILDEIKRLQPQVALDIQRGK
jgi:hypothetical protein